MIYGTENHPIRGVRIRSTSTFGIRCGECFQYLAFLLPGTSITIPLFYSPLGKVSGLWAWHWTRPWPRIGTISLWTRIDCWPPCAPPTSRDSADACGLTTAASGWAWCRYCSGATVCGTPRSSPIPLPLNHRFLLRLGLPRLGGGPILSAQKRPLDAAPGPHFGAQTPRACQRHPGGGHVRSGPVGHLRCVGILRRQRQIPRSPASPTGKPISPIIYTIFRSI